MRIKARIFDGTLSAVLMLAGAGCYTSADNLDTESVSSESETDAGTFEDKLLAGCDDTLSVSEFLTSPNGQYRLYMQADGNLVLRNVSTKKALWASGTNGKGAVKLVLQTDGNLALYTSAGKSVWGTGTAGKGSNDLRLNDNGSLVLYAGSRVVWSANGSSSLSSNATASSQLCSGGTGGGVDACPNDPNKTDPGVCGCGVPEGQCNVSTTCGSNAAAPQTYKHIVVFSFENRTWNSVGMGFSSMPYLRSLANQCSYFSNWNETNGAQNSLTQYVGVTSGVSNTSTKNDCSPSPSCRSTDNNIFRQIRLAGGTARNYVEGASRGCSASGNAAKHVPALYYYGSYSSGGKSHNDQDFCNAEVRPYSEFNVNNLPTFAWITPTMCNDGHDCGNGTVDNWAKTNIQRVINSAAYKAGTVAIFVWYDEDRPVPNLTIAPTSHRGKITSVTGSHAALLKTWESMLGLSVMNQGQLPSATNLRSSLGI